MLRLASRSTATSATPHRICVARTRRPVTSSTLTAAREEHMQGWQPGDPIQFASRPEREERAVRGWSPGDPIRFGVVEENIEAGSGASSSRAGSPAKKQARKSTPSPRRPSEYSIATRATGPSSLRTDSPFDRSSASWLSHRFEPPSPSPSVGTGAQRDDSFDSTACFSPSRHGAPQPAMQPHLPQSPSASLEPPPALSFRPVSSSTRSPRGVTQVSQAELDDLVSGVDFEEDLPSSSDAAPLVAPGSSLDPRELDNLVSGIDFSDGFDATDFDDSIEILAQPRPTTSRTPSSPTVPVAASVSRTAPPTSHRFISSPPRPATPQFPAASRTPLRSSNAIIDLTNSSPSLTPPSMRGFATTSKAAMDWDDLLDDEDLHFHSGKPLPSAPAAETERITPAPAKPSASAKSVSKHRKPPTARSRSAAADKENDPKATSKRKGRPLSATALRNRASAEKDAAARAKWARTFNFREWAPRDVKVIYSTNPDEVREVLSSMEGPFGFDLEWNIYGPPQSRRAALVQVCDRKTVLLVHVARMWGESGKERKGFVFPDALKEFIEDDSKIKLGVNIGGDATKLKKDFDHSPRGILDLNSIRLRHDPETIAHRRLVSLQQLVGSYLDCYLPKDSDIRCSRWHERLSDQQLEYAANDVYSSLMVAHAIHSLADLSLEEAHADLRSLVDSPLPRNVVSRQAPPAAVDAEYASPREAALAALSPRRLELFGYFSDSTLSFDDIHAKMNETGSMKPLSVVWTLLSTYAELRTKGVEDGFDVSRLRDFALAVEEDWSPRFLAEHGTLVSELRRVAPAQSKASG